MRTSRAILLGSVSLVLLLLILPFHRDEVPGTPEIRGSFMKKIRIRHFSGERLDWEADIQQATLDEATSDILLKKVSLSYPDRNFRMISESGTYNLKDSRISFTGKVKGETTDLAFYSGKLDYRPETREILAGGGISIRGKNFLITGEKGIITGDEKIIIDGDVHAEFF